MAMGRMIDCAAANLRATVLIGMLPVREQTQGAHGTYQQVPLSQIIPSSRRS